MKRINKLLKDIERDPFGGIGKSEPLKYQEEYSWSRRIDETNRLVYRIKDNMLEIIQCKGHYDN